MAVDKLVDSTQLDADLTSVANAIRTKGSTSAQLAFPSGFVSAIESIPSGVSGPKLELIGTYTVALEEYTNTSTIETTNTGINVQNTNYAFVLVIVTCDTPVTTATEWGMTMGLLGRYGTGNSLIYMPSALNAGVWLKGASTLTTDAMVSSSQFTGNNIGLTFKNAVGTIQIQRKANASSCPILRAGNYTVAAYGIASL